MVDDSQLKVVLCWHMHQPDYRDHRTDTIMQPWTYLRAIKDYTDMAAHLEMIDNACAVVNFAPVLLEQLEFYHKQIDNHLKHDRLLHDPLLMALARRPDDPVQDISRLLQQCLNGRNRQYEQRHKSYHDLMAFARHLLKSPQQVPYINHHFIDDLLVWFHLAWFGETVQRNDPRLQRFIQQAGQFSFADRKQLLEIIGEQIAAVIPRYRSLADAGKVELSMSPYAHPLAPLMLDFASAREALPEITLPDAAGYPGGRQQLAWHISQGREIFIRCFGHKPIGCWPSEGALSEAVLKQLNDAGFHWTASGAGVLHNSLKAAGQVPEAGNAVHHCYQYKNLGIRCFFRDDGLSDLIGFTYSSWHADDAVANLVHHLDQIHQHSEERKNTIAVIIMDGENAWEHYPYNAFYFLQALYQRLSSHPKFQLTTFSRCLGMNTRPLEQLVAGSWVYGNLSTWIGGTDKNRAWDMLTEAKQQFDRVMHEKRLDFHQEQYARKQMAICEGSDWFWWPGGDNPQTSVSSFDAMYRTQLAALYHFLDITPPDYLARPYTHSKTDGKAALGGVMRKTT